MRRSIIALALSALVSAGCASTTEAPQMGLAGVAPMLSVERFLQAANTGDLDAMARMFGNSDGAIADGTTNTLACAFKRMGSWIGLGDSCLGRSEIELRMNAIALVIQHDDYRVRSEAPVPGRDRPTTRVGVDIDRGAEQFTDVPFLVVQTADGRWLVEEIDLARLTAGLASPLDELPEDTPRTPGMNERHEVAARSEARLGVDELEAFLPETLERLAHIGDPVGEMM